eukprot:gene16989-18701_t
MSQEQELAKKKKIRAGHRGHANKVMTEAIFEMQGISPSTIEMEHYVQTLTEKELHLRNLDEEIIMLIDEEDIETEIFDAEERRTELKKTIVKLKKKLEEVSLETASFGSSHSSNSSNSNQPVHPPSFNIPNLPKLELPKYNGDPKRWNEWWDVFVSAIHENGSLTPVFKLRHLKTLLEGPAAATLSGLTLTSANYSEAIELLKSRYGQTQVVINAHMEALLKMNHVPSMKDAKSLRKLYDEIEIHVRSLKSLGVHSEQYGTLLIPIVMNKMPEEIRLSISKELKSENWTLDDILRLFCLELEARERCNLTPGMGQRPPQARQPASHTTTSALLSTGGPTTSITCSFCRQKHLSAKCPVVTEPSSRKEILKKQGRCFVCLKRGHLSRECQSNVRCFSCGRRHHSSICEGNQNRTPVSPDTNNSENVNNQSSVDRNSIPNQQQNRQGQQGSSTTAMFVDTRNSVLLQTAKGYVSAPNDPGNSQLARLIFDNGSQKSYVSEELRNKLRLPTLSQETLSIKTFGMNDGTLQVCDLTQIAVRSPFTDEVTYVDVYVVPMVCAPLTRQVIKEAVNLYPHLQRIPLADFNPNGEELDVQILIGADAIWNLMTGRSIRGELGPVALETKLGWVLSGTVPGVITTSTTQTNLIQTHVLRVGVETYSQMTLNTKGEETLEDQLGKFWNLESIGITQSEDKSVLEEFVDDISFVEGRYEVKLPWKKNHGLLPDNYTLSLGRLNKLKKKLSTKPEMLEAYDEIIREQEKNGIIERVEKDEPAPIGRTHYIPHQPHKDAHPEITDKLLNALYVDDVTTGDYEEEKCMKIYSVSRKMMTDGGFNLRKWRTNSKELQEKIETEERKLNRSTEVASATSDDAASEQKLVEGFTNEETKRTVLKSIASVFDPLGLITPMITPIKVLFQEICTTKVGWDERLPDQLRNSWQSWIRSCKKTAKIEVPRYHFLEVQERPTEIELHGFCDASQDAYAAAVYVRYQGTSSTTTDLLMSKTRVSPLKKMSIPRLELLSCLILARLMDNVKKTIDSIVNISNTYYWSDSITAIYWIKGTEKDWKMKERENWWKGPPWLREEKDEWPQMPNSNAYPVDCKEEERVNKKEDGTTSLLVTSTETIDTILPTKNFSCYNKLLRVLSYVKRFINNCDKNKTKRTGQLSAIEIKEAESVLIRDIQRELRSKENKQLKYQLGIYEDHDDELRTTIIEIEAVINSRPLTHIYDDSLEDPITPSHLVIGKKLIAVPHQQYEEPEDPDFGDQGNIQRRAKRLSLVLKHFQTRWKTEYLSDLREQHRNASKKLRKPLITTDDIVTVMNENNSNRNVWKLGRVESLVIGKDNEVRGAKVRLAKPTTNNKATSETFPVGSLQRETD